MRILVKLFDVKCAFEPFSNGDWLDLHSRYDMSWKAPYADRLSRNKTARTVNFERMMIPLGVAMKLPEGYEAWILPRSSSYKKFGFIQANSMGVVDNSFRGSGDEWMLPVIPLEAGEVKAGDRVCQFRIALSQKATPWQRIKWLFNHRIEFDFVRDFDGDDRGGFGSTGV